MMFSKYNIIYSGNQTFLVYSPGKNEEINYSQVEMFENQKYKEYFLSFECTKNRQTNRIIFNITGLTSLSEYIKTNLMQEQYFEIITGIQKITSFCEESSMSFGNLICNPKYMYYHYVSKKLYMAYVPLKNPNAICDSIPECLQKIHKSTQNIVITDGNYMKKYEDYLNQFQKKRGKKNDTQIFSPYSLLHFLNKNETPSQSADISKTSHSVIDDTDPYSVEYDIGLQTERVFPSGKIQSDLSVQDNQTGSKLSESSQTDQPQGLVFPSSPTVIAGNQPPVQNISEAYLISENGTKYIINEDYYTIGRQAPKSLILTPIDISRFHAVIEKKSDGYYITNKSTSGGTFINENFEDRINTEKLKDGDRIYFYRTKFTFGCVCTQQDTSSSATVIIQESSPTFIADNSDLQRNQPIANEKPLAYLIKCSDNTSIKVTHYPFTSAAVTGIVFYTRSIDKMTHLFIQNMSCESLVFQNKQNIPKGETSEIFSGCILCVNGEQYKFMVEN